MKKLLLLGGSRYLLPVIKLAHEMGVYVITVDYLPENFAHFYADEYHNVSIIDRDAVLQLAKRLKIDGIMSYATDPGVTVAAYVAEQLSLPTCGPYESVQILQNKGKFRKFLSDHDFDVPRSRVYTNVDEVLDDITGFSFPMIVKPVDLSGSRGVSRVNDMECLKQAVKCAKKFSMSGEVIVEEFIEQDGFSTGTDSFSIDGKLVFFSLDNQWFDKDAENPYAPAAHSWPSLMPQWAQNELKSEVQRLLKLLNMGTSIYNIEARLGKDGKVYIMECTPRAGGNRLAEVLKMATGQDMIKAAVQAALGIPVTQNFTDPMYNGYWGEIILHSNQSGVFHGLEIDKSLSSKIEELDVWIKEGDEISAFTGANKAIGIIVLRCKTGEELSEILNNVSKYICIKVFP